MSKRAVIFDFNRTLYDPDAGALYEGVVDLLVGLTERRRLFLFSKEEGGRDTLLRDVGIEEYFEKVYFVEEKTPENLAQILTTHDLTPESSYIVGDLVRSELRAGRAVGMDTIWVRQGRFTDEPFEPSDAPTHTVSSIRELGPLFERLD